MKYSLLCAAFALVLGISSTASASVHVLDFENGVNDAPFTNLGNSALQTYLETTLGRTNVDAGDTRYWGSEPIFGSDAILTNGYSSELNFDTTSSGSSNYEITALSFRWGVLDSTSGVDFGLDVYDDSINNWRSEVFTVSGVSDYSSGFSGLITFNASWQITRIRFHDSGSYDVAMDNLTLHDNVVDNPTVPEPTAMIVWSLLGLAFGGRLCGARPNRSKV